MFVPGVTHLVSAVSSNDRIALRKLLLRDNYISSKAGTSPIQCHLALARESPAFLAGDLIVDALYRNQSLTIADFLGSSVSNAPLTLIQATKLITFVSTKFGVFVEGI